MFASSWPRVVAALSALVFGTLLGASLLAAPSASAVDLPIVGTAECDNAVDRADEVIAARANLTTATANATKAGDAVIAATKAREVAAAATVVVPGQNVPEDATDALTRATANLKSAVSAEEVAAEQLLEANAELSDVRDNAVAWLCTTANGDGTPKSTPPIVTPAPSTTVVVPPAPTVFVPAPSVETETVTRAPTAVVVELDPLADDGSVADTDGTQITIVPAGSASTGGGA